MGDIPYTTPSNSGQLYENGTVADQSGSQKAVVSVIKVNTVEQLKQYMTIRWDVFVEEIKVDSTDEVDEYDGRGEDVEEANKKAVHLMALVGGVPAGTARLLLLPGKICKACRIATLPQFRSKGLGRVLMSAIHEAAAEHGYKTCKLAAQVGAIGFYQRLNYSLVPGEIFMDAGIAHRWMKIELGTS